MNYHILVCILPTAVVWNIYFRFVYGDFGIGGVLTSLLVLVIPAFLHSELLPLGYKPDAFLFGFFEDKRRNRKLMWAAFILGVVLAFSNFIIGSAIGKLAFVISVLVSVVLSLIGLYFLKRKIEEGTK